MSGSVDAPEAGWYGDALAKGAMGRHAEALDSLDRALALDPTHRDGWYNRGVALGKLGRNLDALLSYDKAVALDPGFGAGWRSHGNALVLLKCYREALVSYATAAKCDPRPGGLAGAEVYARTMLCDWDGLDAAYQAIADAIGRGENVTHVGGILASPLDAWTHLRCAEIAVAARHPGCGTRPPLAPDRRGRRIRVGYVSGDLRNHPVGYQALALLRQHDRRAFEVHAYSLFAAEGDACQAEISRTADAFFDLSALDTQSAVSLVRSHVLDIAIDLQGHTVHSRMALFAESLAPLQVNFLCPGTSGARFLDYIIADDVVIPPDAYGAYSERVASLPASFFIADYPTQAASPSTSRESEGLPAEATVFACFSDSYKISPQVFAVWMRLLQRVEGSVLWLGQRSTEASADALRQRVAECGIPQDRLVMARYADTRAEHLARLPLADLCLDTHWYNGHTTVADALWAGVPVVTVTGPAFCGRVAASLLQAADLEELVARDLTGYEDLAARMGTDAELRARLRARLAKARHSAALFDTRRTVRNVEKAFRAMVERAWRGEAPASFAVGH